MSPCCTGFPDVRLGTDELINLSKHNSLWIFIYCFKSFHKLWRCCLFICSSVLSWLCLGSCMGVWWFPQPAGFRRPGVLLVVVFILFRRSLGINGENKKTCPMLLLKADLLIRKRMWRVSSLLKYSSKGLTPLLETLGYKTLWRRRVVAWSMAYFGDNSVRCRACVRGSVFVHSTAAVSRCFLFVGSFYPHWYSECTRKGKLLLSRCSCLRLDY